MINIREERATDVVARENLLDEAYGAVRFTKASERLREGHLPAKGLSLVAVEHARIVGTIRLWHVTAGPGRPVLLLGPLAVHRGPALPAIGRFSWLATPRITAASASRRSGPAACGCLAASSPNASWRSSFGPTRSPPPAD
jgi:hypothetical protein